MMQEQGNIIQREGVPQPPASEAKRRIREYGYTSADLTLAVLVFVLGYLFVSWVLLGGGGLGVTAFTLVFLGALLWWLGTKGIRLDRTTAPWLGMIAALGLYPGLYDNDRLKPLAVAALIILVCYLIAAMAQTRVEGRLGGYFAVDCLSALTLPFQNFLGVFHAGASGFQNRKGGKNAFYLLLGVIIALPLVILTGGLLRSADAAFEGLWVRIAGLFTVKNEELLIKGILSLPVSLYFFGLFTSHGINRGHSRRTRQEWDALGARAKALPEMVLLGISVPLIILYLVFFFSQTAYFVSALSGLVPQGLLPAEYARRGFFELCQVSAINLAVIALGRLLSTARQKATPLLLSAFSMGMIVLSLSKMLLYIRLLGLTPLRIYTSWFMLFLLAVFGLVIVKTLRPGVQITRKLVAVGLIMLLVLCYADTDRITAAYNVAAYESGCLSGLDVSLLGRLGHGATPSLLKIIESEAATPEMKARAKEILHESFFGITPWTGRNVQLIAGVRQIQAAEIDFSD